MTISSLPTEHFVIFAHRDTLAYKGWVCRVWALGGPVWQAMSGNPEKAWADVQDLMKRFPEGKMQ